jgi:sec-independent protein translocase protein TatB
MAGLGISEIILIFVIALVVIGPKQLPQVARHLGRLAGDVKRTLGDFNRDVQRASNATYDDLKKTRDDIQNNISDKKDSDV